MSHHRNAPEMPQARAWHIMPALFVAAALAALVSPRGEGEDPNAMHARADIASHQGSLQHASSNQATLLVPSAEPGEGEPAIELAEVARTQWY